MQHDETAPIGRCARRWPQRIAMLALAALAWAAGPLPGASLRVGGAAFAAEGNPLISTRSPSPWTA